jgi:peptidoglycan/xylan/chitin deacetylase (PgdA/CDA1 family)
MKPVQALTCFSVAVACAAEAPRTEITRWQDGKDACVSLTFDDSSINQFRIFMPMLNERGLHGTFFIITGGIQGSRNKPAFAGRPMMEIIRESATVATTKQNLFERTSLLNHLKTVQRVDAIRDFNAQGLGRLLRQGNYEELGRTVDGFMAKLRETGATYSPRDPETPRGDRRYAITWDELRRHAAEGHEFANHSVTHPYMPALDEANIAYELEKSTEDIREQLGAKHTFSVEAPYGIDDQRVRPTVQSRFPLTRNWVTDTFMDGILRGNSRDPSKTTMQYMQWQRGPAATTSIETMKGWVDTSLAHGIWLVLVFHGVEGIGYEALPTEIVRSYFDYIRANEGRLWVATYQDGAKYTRERANSSVETRPAGEAIEVSVKHSLDPKLYDVPLTARTTIPTDWRIARFRQGSEVRWLPVHRGEGEPYVLYRIAPDGKMARIEKAAN